VVPGRSRALRRQPHCANGDDKVLLQMQQNPVRRESRFMGSFHLQHWARIEAMNRTKTPHPAFGHPLPIRWGEGRVRGRFMEGMTAGSGQ